MIQRIQTVYLFLVFALLLSLFFASVATFIGGNEEFRIIAWGIENTASQEITVPTTHMGILLVLATLLPLVNIFFFKRRWLQLRLCIVEIILLVGLQIFICIYLVKANSSIALFDTHSIKYSVVGIFPVIGMILSYLAFRGVVKDETLIKSLNRIR